MRSVLESIRSRCPGCSAIALADAPRGALTVSVADTPSDAALLDRAAAILPDSFNWLEALDAPAPFSDKPQPAGLSMLVIAVGSRQLVVLRGSDTAVLGLVTPREAQLLLRTCGNLLVEQASAA